MKIKWTRHNRLDKDPVITGTSQEAPHLIFWKDADGNVKSRLRKVAQESDRVMDAMNEQRGTLMMMPQEQLNSLNIEWTTTVLGQEGTCAEHPGLVFRRDSSDNVVIDKALLEQRSKDANRAINDAAWAQYTQMQRERLAEITSELEVRTIDPAYAERR